MMQATPQQSLYWECSTCTTTSGLSLDGCDVRLGWGSFEGVDAIIFFGWGGRDPVPLKVQGQLNFRGPGGMLPVGLLHCATPQGADSNPWTRAETQVGIERRTDGV